MVPSQPVMGIVICETKYLAGRYWKVMCYMAESLNFILSSWCMRRNPLVFAQVERGAH